jgi:hypothetical protein
MKSKLTGLIALFFILSSTACGLKGIKVPADKQDYIGVWLSKEISLSISAEGRVEYQKNSGGSKKSISAPIQKFEGNNFVVGALGINTTFVVSETPHKDDTGLWKMTVDGVELSRVQ